MPMCKLKPNVELPKIQRRGEYGKSLHVSVSTSSRFLCPFFRKFEKLEWNTRDTNMEGLKVYDLSNKVR
jgi:hypothetical protein